MKRDGASPPGELGRTRSVQRALAVLDVVGNHPYSVGISEVSSEVGLPVSTVHRLLATLVDAGYVYQSPDDGKYQVGLRAFQTGRVYLQQTKLLDVARVAMRNLSAQAAESVNLAVHDGYFAVYVDQIESQQALKLFTRTGSRVSLYCTGVGKVFLSGFSREEFDAYVAAIELLPRTPNTITDPDILRSQTENVRRRGFAIDDEEFEIGVRCVAAPLFDDQGEIVAALSVSGPAQRVTRSTAVHIAELVTETAQGISKRLGYSPNVALGHS